MYDIGTIADDSRMLRSCQSMRHREKIRDENETMVSV